MARGNPTHSLVEDMARAISEAGGASNWDHALEVATAALSVLKDRLPADDRELVEQLRDTANVLGGLQGVHPQRVLYISKAADRIIALSVGVEIHE